MPVSALEQLLRAPAGWALRADAAVPAPVPPKLPPRCELAVVGAGLTGLAAALTAAQAGCSVVLLESHRVGSGATGRNSGFVIPITARIGPGQLRQWLGTQAPAFTAALGTAAAALLAEPGANAARKGWMQLFLEPPSSEQQALAQAWADLGVRARLLQACDVQALAGTSHYQGGMLLEDGGQIDPLALARALADRCRALGVVVAEHCPVTEVRPGEGDAWQTLHTPAGTVQARRVLMAGNAYSHEALRPAARHSVPLELVLGQFDLAPAALREILPADIPFSDNCRDMWFFRKTPQGKLMTGWFALNRHASASSHAEHLRQRIQTVFGVKPAPSEDIWAGRVGLTPDGLPRLFAQGAGVWAWSGCNGRGLALSYMVGQTLARQLICGAPELLPPVYKPLHGRVFVQWLAQAAIAGDRWRRARVSIPIVD
ncbi:NAD(P)/FAD-dependent oxidoreductase [Azohydromonas lata]|uniref:NAD(P)/FAD-dependent oxidoreductase n=1 Tax=Azohydromonas lata TaxID=45677 RepID=UPI00082B18A7|nr:FAD-dependent oxidoreductase [Azohydromonas lata]